jgi:hypothetical protein
MIVLYAVVMGYLLLMRVEFFVPHWLKRHQLMYVVSHMIIIPLIDVYASGLDWFLGGFKAPVGLLFFFAVSFMNGIVLEFGRKIKPPDSEEEGVLSYTKYFGTKKSSLGLDFRAYCNATVKSGDKLLCKLWFSSLLFFWNGIFNLSYSCIPFFTKTRNKKCKTN